MIPTSRITITAQEIMKNSAIPSVMLRSAVAGRRSGLVIWVTLSGPTRSPHPIVPIPGTTKRDRLEENLAAADVELTAEDLRTIEEATSEIEIRGARYTERWQRMVDG